MSRGARRRGASRRPAAPQTHQAPPKRLSGARPRTPIRRSVGVYLLRHLQAAVSTLGRLVRNPTSSLMTIAVIGVALTLPTGLHLLIKNLGHASEGWEGATEISLFLERSVSDGAAKTLARGLAAREDIRRAEAIGREEALAEFRRLSGFGDAVRLLDENPLPAVVILRPAPGDREPAAVERLVDQLAGLAEVDRAQLDRQWLRRFQAILDTARRLTMVVGALLGVAVVVIVGNTIRLDIQSRREEIEVTKLIGGTNAFIRRPFLYIGLWYGALGAVLSTLLVTAGVVLVRGPAQRLASLYDSQAALQGLGAEPMLLLLAAGPLLGWLGAWVAVGRHLHEIEPR